MKAYVTSKRFGLPIGSLRRIYWVKVYAGRTKRSRLLLEFVINNIKVGDPVGDIVIFNVTSATDCMGHLLGHCLIRNFCYALDPERRFPSVLRARRRQADQWDGLSVKTLCSAFDCGIREAINHGANPIGFRFNEAGEFRHQADVDKMTALCSYLDKNFRFFSFGYTTRQDLDFSKRTFKVKGSGWNGPDGSTVVMHRRDIDKLFDSSDKPRAFVCHGTARGGCYTCRVCKTTDRPVILPLH